MIFVSAHGFRDNQQNYYLSTHEVDPDKLYSTGVPWYEIKKKTDAMPCKVVAFIDTCHSGGITGAKGSVRDPLRDLVAPEVGVIVFGSSTPKEQSLENAAWGHGAFTRAIVDTLGAGVSDKDEPPDGLLTITELDLNISRRVKELTMGMQHPVVQKPSSMRDFNVMSLLLSSP